MKPKLYLETTIPSYLTARPSLNMTTALRQKITHDWWHLYRGDYEIWTSATVRDEAIQGDVIYAGKRMEVLEGIPLLDATEQVLALTQALLPADHSGQSSSGCRAHCVLRRA